MRHGSGHLIGRFMSDDIRIFAQVTSKPDDHGSRGPYWETTPSKPGSRAGQPPAIAQMIRKGFLPDTTASGSGASGEASDQSSSQAKNLNIGRRLFVVISRIVPRSAGWLPSNASRTDRWVTGLVTSNSTTRPTPASV